MSVNPNGYPVDLTASNPRNRIQDEIHNFDNDGERIFVPAAGPFYMDTLTVHDSTTGKALIPDEQFKVLHLCKDASRISGKPVCAIVMVTDKQVSGVSINYSVIGGDNLDTINLIRELIKNAPTGALVEVSWGHVLNAPVQYNPVDHLHHVRDWYGMNELIAQIEGFKNTLVHGDILGGKMYFNYIREVVLGHFPELRNMVSKDSTGLGNVQNYAVASVDDVENSLPDRYLTPNVLSYFLSQLKATATNHSGRIAELEKKIELFKPQTWTLSSQSPTAREGDWWNIDITAQGAWAGYIVPFMLYKGRDNGSWEPYYQGTVKLEGTNEKATATIGYKIPDDGIEDNSRWAACQLLFGATNFISVPIDNLAWTISSDKASVNEGEGVTFIFYAPTAKGRLLTINYEYVKSPTQEHKSGFTPYNDREVPTNELNAPRQFQVQIGDDGYGYWAINIDNDYRTDPDAWIILTYNERNAIRYGIKINDTSKTVPWTLTTNKNAVNEGENITFTLYALSEHNKAVNAELWIRGQHIGRHTFSLNDQGYASAEWHVSADQVTNPNSFVTVSLTDYPDISTTVPINDTSMDNGPLNITANKAAVLEGDSVQFTYRWTPLRNRRMKVNIFVTDQSNDNVDIDFDSSGQATLTWPVLRDHLTNPNRVINTKIIDHPSVVCQVPVTDRPWTVKANKEYVIENDTVVFDITAPGWAGTQVRFEILINDVFVTNAECWIIAEEYGQFAYTVPENASSTEEARLTVRYVNNHNIATSIPILDVTGRNWGIWTDQASVRTIDPIRINIHADNRKNASASMYTWFDTVNDAGTAESYFIAGISKGTATASGPHPAGTTNPPRGHTLNATSVAIGADGYGRIDALPRSADNPKINKDGKFRFVLADNTSIVATVTQTLIDPKWTVWTDRPTMNEGETIWFAISVPSKPNTTIQVRMVIGQDAAMQVSNNTYTLTGGNDITQSFDLTTDGNGYAGGSYSLSGDGSTNPNRKVLLFIPERTTLKAASVTTQGVLFCTVAVNDTSVGEWSIHSAQPSVNEGDSAWFGVTCADLKNGQVTLYRQVHTNNQFTSDLGNITLSLNDQGIGSTPIGTLVDQTTNVGRSLKVGFVDKPHIYTSCSINDTSKTPWTIWPDRPVMNEGEGIAFGVRCDSRINAGVPVVLQELQNGVLVRNLETYNLNIDGNGYASFVYQLPADGITNPGRKLRAVFSEVNTYADVTINDTSSGVWGISPTSVSVNEGDNAVWNIKCDSRRNSQVGVLVQVLQWNAWQADLQFFPVNIDGDGNGQVVYFVQPDNSTNPGRVLRALYTDDRTIYSDMGINDTSLTPWSIWADRASINEGEEFWVGVKCDSKRNGQVGVMVQELNWGQWKQNLQLMNVTVDANGNGSFGYTVPADQVTNPGRHIRAIFTDNNAIYTDVPINDTSKRPWKIKADRPVMNEGEGIWFEVWCDSRIGQTVPVLIRYQNADGTTVDVAQWHLPINGDGYGSGNFYVNADQMRNPGRKLIGLFNDEPNTRSVVDINDTSTWNPTLDDGIYNPGTYSVRVGPRCSKLLRGSGGGGGGAHAFVFEQRKDSNATNGGDTKIVVSSTGEQLILAAGGFKGNSGYWNNGSDYTNGIGGNGGQVFPSRYAAENLVLRTGHHGSGWSGYQTPTGGAPVVDNYGRGGRGQVGYQSGVGNAAGYGCGGAGGSGGWFHFVYTNYTDEVQVLTVTVGGGGVRDTQGTGRYGDPNANESDGFGGYVQVQNVDSNAIPAPTNTESAIYPRINQANKSSTFLYTDQLNYPVFINIEDRQSRGSVRVQLSGDIVTHLNNNAGAANSQIYCYASNYVDRYEGTFSAYYTDYNQMEDFFGVQMPKTIHVGYFSLAQLISGVDIPLNNENDALSNGPCTRVTLSTIALYAKLPDTRHVWNFDVKTDGYARPRSVLEMGRM